MMKFARLAAAAALAVGSLVSGSAMAGAVCSGCGFSGDPSTTGVNSWYLGTHNPGLDDQSNGIFHNQMDTIGTFTDYWVFDVIPAGQATTNFFFNPTGNVTNFNVDLFASAGSSCTTFNAACTTIGLGALIASNGPSPFVNIPFGPSLSGVYVIRVTGTVVNGPGNEGYSGNVSTTNVPEPTSLALVGLALVGAGLVARRRAA